MFGQKVPSIHTGRLAGQMTAQKADRSLFKLAQVYYSIIAAAAEQRSKYFKYNLHVKMEQYFKQFSLL